ncbi:pyridoxine 5'-phosphate synthase [Candidatus Saganbacteria bacterium]|uniref:Pyridoxine 5'-phosphate synthase n=1 Tax=Candidatus Saganbacteria bacterium TaxID=2575572 RepID=A0A9D6UM09_UNCSA|nr:pyridoxine 5'-phosphate synthase [Candidatus Saganbacteria bacterium]
MRLGVNIDHIATLREARKETFPDTVLAAREALAGGSDGIVCHLREDRRHIQDKDVFRLRELKTRLDLEMAATPEMLRFALKVKPDMVTIVPEKRRELTTEGGLNIKSEILNPKSEIRSFIGKLQKTGSIVSLFVDPEIEQIEAAGASGAEFVEFHTGRYAGAASQQLLGSQKELNKIRHAVVHARFVGLRVNAGHGLDYNNVREIVKISGVEELNIGFSIIARSVVAGMRQAVAEMREAMG